MERENFYILLELSTQQPISDEAAIKDAVRKKKQEWTRWGDHPAKRGAGMKYLSMASEIEKTMLDPRARAAELEKAKVICHQMLGQCQSRLRIIEGKGYITTKEVAAIVAKYKAYGVDKEYIKRTAKCRISDKPAPNVAIELAGEILDSVTAKTIQRNLELLEMADLYEFLEQEPYSSIQKLCDSARQKQKEAGASANKTSTATLTQELAGICLNVFENFAAKQRYDRLLKVSKYPVLNELIDEEYLGCKFISPNILLRFVNFAVESYDIKILEAEDYIRKYCACHQIPISNQSSEIICPACSAKLAGSAKVCTSCGAPCRGDCPACGTGFNKGQAVCSECGFAIGEMVKGLSYINLAENALIDNNWSSAQRNLQYASKYWPSHEKIQLLERRTKRLGERYAFYVDSIGDCINHRQYYAAAELVEEALARRIRPPSPTVAHIQKVITQLEQEIQKLQTQTEAISPRDILRLVGMVGDSIELNRMLSQYPPEPPAQITQQVVGRKVYVGWELSGSVGELSYIVVRKRSQPSLSPKDGDTVYEGGANTFIDSSAQPLVLYYYSVYTVRGGACSVKSAVARPVRIVPEVEKLKILPMDCAAQLMWDYNEHIHKVNIWRKLGGEKPTCAGDGISLENNRLDGFRDSKLKNDVDYWYFLVAEYIVDGEIIKSKGVCQTASPRKMQAPIDDLIIEKADGATPEYVVNWTQAPNSDVLFFASTKPPEVTAGEVVQVVDLVQGYRQLVLEEKNAGTGRLKYEFSGGIYIFPATISGRFATVGYSKFLINVADVECVTHDIIAGQVMVNMKWPHGLQEIAVGYSLDTFPLTAKDAGGTLSYCTKKEYDENAGVLLHEPLRAVYYITIFGVYTTPSGEKIYSQGVTLKVDNRAQQNVFYTLKYKKSLFTDKAMINVTVSCEEHMVLPKATFVGKVGRLPLKKSDGVPLFELDKEIKIKGAVSFSYVTTTLPQNLYARLFFHDDTQNQNYRILPINSMKIT